MKIGDIVRFNGEGQVYVKRMIDADRWHYRDIALPNATLTNDGDYKIIEFGKFDIDCIGSDTDLKLQCVADPDRVVYAFSTDCSVAGPHNIQGAKLLQPLLRKLERYLEANS